MASIIKRIEIWSKSKRTQGGYNIYEVLDDGTAYLRIYNAMSPEIRIKLDANDIDACSKYYWAVFARTSNNPKGYIRTPVKKNSGALEYISLQRLIYDRHVHAPNRRYICFRDGDPYNCRMDNLTAPADRGIIACRRSLSKNNKSLGLPAGVTMYKYANSKDCKVPAGIYIKCIYGNLMLSVAKFGSIDACINIARSIYDNILENVDLTKDYVEMQAYFEIIKKILGGDIKTRI